MSSTAAPANGTPPSDDGAIVVTARGETPGDPAAALNAQTYEVVDSVDRAVVGPIAIGYEKGLPKPIRSGLHNFLANLTKPVVFANFLLQGKPGKAFETVGRFAVNSTIGVAGLIDVAKSKPFRLPRRVNGFANTLGFYGIGPGPYLYLPIIGPSSARDLFGWVLDKSFLPSFAGKPFSDPAYALGTGTVKSLDDRVEFDAMIRCFRDTGDPYGAERDYYLARRKAEIDGLHTRDAGRPAPITTPGCPPPE